MGTFARPYNNLSVPGANVNDTLTLKGLDPATSTAKAFAQLILRGQGTEADLALAQNPTFIAVWIGGNDVLGSVLAGTPALLTPLRLALTGEETGPDLASLLPLIGRALAASRLGCAAA